MVVSHCYYEGLLEICHVQRPVLGFAGWLRSVNRLCHKMPKLCRSKAVAKSVLVLAGVEDFMLAKKKHGYL